MTTEIRMPQFGESVTEGTIGRWLKRPGETVQKYEPLLEIVTDKVDTELPSPVSGTLLELIVAEGETVRVGTLLARIVPADTGQSPFLSPVVARLLAENRLNPAQITGSGQNGRVTKQDVLHAIAKIEESVSAPTSSALSPQPSALSPQPSVPNDAELIPLSPMRRAIAEHMERSIRTAPHVTAVIEVDLSRVVAHRTASRDTFAAQGVRLTFTPYFIQAALAGLQAAPLLNGSFSPEGIILHRRTHIGVAVSLPEGLIVPVLHDADERNLLGLARSLGDLVERVRTHQLRPDETQGGTFTLTNHGTSGSLFATPIINQPQSGILGVGAIVKRPVVVSYGTVDAIAIKPMCYLSLTFDHRVADGAVGNAFLAAAKRFLET
ncbi:MAG: dihydrolipoamide acetyltransferase family protein [Chloroflexales bacterium]|jgi:2-oxoisovalerate dehydrogenase E2 component (dihydrolipoyl transacylase)